MKNMLKSNNLIIKIVSIILLITMLTAILNCTKVYASVEADNKTREKAFEKAFTDWIEQFKSEDTPEEKRIVDYQMTGYGISSDLESEVLTANISFNVVPYSEENTVWQKAGNSCFVRFLVENGEYKLERISELPENYDKFVEKFEEYKKEHPEIDVKTEKVVENSQAKKADYNESNTVTKISIGVFAISLVVFILMLVLVIRIIKNK